MILQNGYRDCACKRRQARWHQPEELHHRSNPRLWTQCTQEFLLGTRAYAYPEQCKGTWRLPPLQALQGPLPGLYRSQRVCHPGRLGARLRPRINESCHVRLQQVRRIPHIYHAQPAHRAPRPHASADSLRGPGGGRAHELC